jgi:hypothetical protein
MYMSAAPAVFQESQPVPLPSTTRYYMMQPTMVPTGPFLTTAFAYPGYSLITQPVEKTESAKSQIQEGIN